ncbi:MAG: ABC transporter ATP-binding protein [Desulfobacterales bacterium]|nr:MAG: ABC transporter ATP-binding protein [Desulfobacterales bacterium]
MNNERQQSLLSARQLVKRFSQITAVNHVSLEIASGQLLAILGPSGCGKSTLLQMIAGLTCPDSGSITYAGNYWVKPSHFVPPEERDCGMVFQDMALFPHLSVADNIGFAIERHQKKRVVDKMLETVGLKGVNQRMVYELSGGQQQRVALARSLASEPGLLLLDEPFSSLDFKLRQSMRREVRKILKKQQVTAILVTHDQNEAFAFADTVAVMFAGRLEQQGSPQEIYLKPVTRTTAAFVGDANFVALKHAGSCFPQLQELKPNLQHPDNLLMCRPEDIWLDPEQESATVVTTEFQGAWYELQLELDCGGQLSVHTRRNYEKGRRLAAIPERGCIYSPQGQLLGVFENIVEQVNAQRDNGPLERQPFTHISR